MTQENPITPSTELVQQWVDTYFGGKISQSNFHLDLATRAAQWGADQELKACCDWLSVPCPSYGRELRNARRPKTPSLKELALAALNEIEDRHAGPTIQEELIRRALEQLDD
jgi:hypothetical protein